MKLSFHGLEVTVSYTPRVPGQYTGPPERCYPEEPDSIEIVQVRVIDKAAVADWLFVDSVLEDHFSDELLELARAEHERLSEPHD